MIKINIMQPRQIGIQAKEIVIKESEKGAFFDAFIYEPEKINLSKGHLLLVGQINTEDDSLSYAPNLIASFIKREYYESKEENNQLSFENSLKKANELITDLCKNKNASVDMSAALVYGQNIHVSKVGKSKLLLARNSECFDIFKNVNLFEKTHFSNKEFSNIVSGKLSLNDKLLLFIPTRRLTAKESEVKAKLQASAGDNFQASVIELGGPAKAKAGNPKTPFNCCGIWFEVKEIKEEVTAPMTEDINNEAASVPTPEENKTVDEKIIAQNAGIAFPMEISKGVKENPFTKSFYFAKNLKKMNLLNNKKTAFILLASVIIAAGGGLLIFNQRKSGASAAKLLNQAEEQVKLAESKVLTGESKEARRIIEIAIKDAENLEIKGDKKTAFLASAQSILDKVDKTNSNKPAQISEINPQFSLKAVGAAAGDEIFIADGSLIKTVKDSMVNDLYDFTSLNEGSSPIISFRIFKNNLVGVTESGNILIYNFETKKGRSIKSGYQPLRDFGIYEGNIYLLLANSLLKVPDFLESDIKFQPWFKTAQEKSFHAVNADQSIHLIADGVKLLRYFKGEVIEENSLEFSVSENSKIFDLVSSFLIFDADNRKARITDRSGKLVTTYYLDNIDSAVDASYNSDSSTLYILSPRALWSLKIEK